MCRTKDSILSARRSGGPQLLLRSVMVDPVRFYNLEAYLFEDVSRRFQTEGTIGAFDLFSIIVWKANRAKTRLARRLLAAHGDLEDAARQLSSSLFRAQSPEDRLHILMQEWGFYLPMASAILSVLWPDEFTVYDVRVCDELGDFHWLGNRSKQASVWQGYQLYLAAVQNAAPHGLSLRDKDRYLWGRAVAKQLEHDLESGFGSGPAK